MPGGPEARAGQLVVEPGGGAVADVRAERGMQRAQDLQQDEQHADDAERNGQRLMMLDGVDDEAGRDREPGRKQAAQGQQGPPARCQCPVGMPERGGKLQLLPVAQAGQRQSVHHLRGLALHPRKCHTRR